MHVCFAITLSFVILLGISITPQASIAGPTPAGGDGPWSQVCPMCCQGPAGTPGIPGLPGNQGQYGPPGAKGDAGDKGQKGGIGPNGAVGNPGPRGDEGMGLPGKAGPRGPSGLVGITGESGIKGQKGEPGETPDSSVQQVAFTVTRRTHSGTSESYSTRLSFDQAETLLPGTNFDLPTGTFTCNVPGTYVFSFSVCKYYSISEIWVSLRKNHDPIVYGGSSDVNRYEQVSGSAVLVLQQGDLVYLAMYGRAYTEPTFPATSFSGFLLYAE